MPFLPETQGLKSQLIQILFTDREHMVDVPAAILVYVRLIEVRNSTSLLTRNKVIFLWTIKAKTLFLKVVVNWDAGAQKDQWPFVEGSTRWINTHGYILNMQSLNVYLFPVSRSDKLMWYEKNKLDSCKV